MYFGEFCGLWGSGKLSVIIRVRASLIIRNSSISVFIYAQICVYVLLVNEGQWVYCSQMASTVT